MTFLLLMRFLNLPSRPSPLLDVERSGFATKVSSGEDEEITLLLFNLPSRPSFGSDAGGLGFASKVSSGEAEEITVLLLTWTGDSGLGFFKEAVK
mmetsp:Transcript_12318/g.14506  ORF Transcript_12318/g.14506 Transcript_12318/m.14506 type:complete len:95 (-) Transcript_12318:358-642(-)